MEGYQVAENEARTINNDICFIGAIGSVRRESIDQTVTVDGKATSWYYIFGSVSAGKEIIVIVSGDLSVTKIKEYVINTTKMPHELASFQDIHPVADWKVDSTQAAQTALPRFTEEHGPDPASATYCLLNYRNKDTGNLAFFWWVTIHGSPVMSDQDGTRTFVIPSTAVFIDPATRAILPEPVSVPELPLE